MEISMSHFMSVLTLLVIAYPGNTEHVCDFHGSCFLIYSNLENILKTHPDDLYSLCSLARELQDCMKRTSKRCRGDLNYHFFEKLVRDMNANIGVGKNCVGGLPKDADSAEHKFSESGPPLLSTPRHHSSHHWNRDHSRDRQSHRCAQNVPDEGPTVGCALFGLTNLKSFSETLNFTDINYCSLSGAWSLIDTPDFAVQITNKGGLTPLPKDITATTLVTVIIKHNRCSERKTYQATFDEVPGMFSDGSTKAGSVYIETVTESEHVKIHFPYLVTTIDIIKVLDKIPIPSLTVTIKVPESLVQKYMTEPKNHRGIPLCFYGCPRTATMKSRGEGAVSPRSASPSSARYYKSQCPHPQGKIPLDSRELLEQELPQADSSSVPATIVHGGRRRSFGDDSEFSRSLSLEFLSHGGTSGAFANSDFGGQRSQRSSSSSTAVICASLHSVHEILSDTTVIRSKLKIPGEERLFGSSAHPNRESNFVSAMNSALASRSAPLFQIPVLIVFLTVLAACIGS